MLKYTKQNEPGRQLKSRLFDSTAKSLKLEIEILDQSENVSNCNPDFQRGTSKAELISNSLCITE